MIVSTNLKRIMSIFFIPPWDFLVFFILTNLVKTEYDLMLASIHLMPFATVGGYGLGRVIIAIILKEEFDTEGEEDELLGKPKAEVGDGK